MSKMKNRFQRNAQGDEKCSLLARQRNIQSHSRKINSAHGSWNLVRATSCIVRSLISFSGLWSATFAMYPNVGNFSGINVNTDSGGQGRGGYGQPGPPGWPPSQLGSTPNGPNGPNPPPPAASNLPLLRVQIAEHLRTSPPVGSPPYASFRVVNFPWS